MDKEKQKAAQARIDRAGRTLLEVTGARGIYIIAVFEDEYRAGLDIAPDEFSYVSSHGAVAEWHIGKARRELKELKTLLTELLTKDRSFRISELHAYLSEIQPGFKYNFNDLKPQYYATVKNWVEQRLAKTA